MSVLAAMLTATLALVPAWWARLLALEVLASELSAELASVVASKGTSVKTSSPTWMSAGQAWMLTLTMLVSEQLSVLASVLAP